MIIEKQKNDLLGEKPRHILNMQTKTNTKGINNKDDVSLWVNTNYMLKLISNISQLISFWLFYPPSRGPLTTTTIYILY